MEKQIRISLLIITVISLFGIAANAWQKTINLGWNPPTQNEDETLIDDLASYNVYTGAESNLMRGVVTNIPAPSAVPAYGDMVTAEITVSNDVWIAVTALDDAGNESAFSVAIPYGNPKPGPPRISIIQETNIILP